MGNPIINCPECHMRVHTLCLNLSKVKRCGRCIYNRLPNTDREGIPECFLCHQKGLVPQRVGGRLFAHTFCLIANQIDKMENNSITLDHEKINKKEGKKREC